MTMHSADAERLGWLAIVLEDTAYELRRRVTDTTAACVAAGVTPPSTVHVLRVVDWLREQAADVRRRIVEAVRADRISGGVGILRHIARVQDAWVDGVWDGVAGIAKGAAAVVQTSVANTIDAHAIGEALVDGDLDRAGRRVARIVRRDWKIDQAILHNVSEMNPALGPWRFAREAAKYGVWTAAEDAARSAGTQAPSAALILASSGVGAVAEAGTMTRVSSVVKAASDVSNVSVFAPVDPPATFNRSTFDRPPADRPATTFDRPPAEEGPLPSEPDAEAAGRRHSAQALP